MLLKVVLKFLGRIEGVCVKCGSKDIGFVQTDNGVCKLVCKACGSTEIVNVKFKHAKKVFEVGYVKDVFIKKESQA